MFICSHNMGFTYDLVLLKLDANTYGKSLTRSGTIFTKILILRIMLILRIFLRIANFLRKILRIRIFLFTKILILRIILILIIFL